MLIRLKYMSWEKIVSKEFCSTNSKQECSRPISTTFVIEINHEIYRSGIVVLYKFLVTFPRLQTFNLTYYINFIILVCYTTIAISLFNNMFFLQNYIACA